MKSHQGADVGWRGNNDSAAQAFFAENLFDELLDFTAAFTDQADNNDLGFRVTCHHAEQYAFANAGTGKQAHPLTAPDRQQGINCADANIK